ncbi:MAG TPA: phage major capsid protein [Mycobacterium sp.]|jgi:HK97 family phage major capsid protein|uniref:phage major capsid protein n=1 Tax=Mycobacterium sp. TaxID=1785 RepID=UPI002F41D4EF
MSPQCNQPGGPLGYRKDGRPIYRIAGGAPTALDTVRDTRDALSTEIEQLLAAAVPEDRAAAEVANQAIMDKIAQRTTLEERLRVGEAEDVRRKAEADVQQKLGTKVDKSGQPRAYITSEPRTYGPGTRSSYFLDLARDHMQRGDGDGGLDSARDRLRRHQQELDVELPAREARRDEWAEDQSEHEMRRAGVNRRSRESMFEKRVNPNRTDGQGGFFVPPLWLIDEFIDLPRFGRTTANLCKTMGLPTGTDSINLPKVLTGTAAAVQAADAGGVQSTDLTDTSVSAPVRTIAGQQDIAIQLLDQSPISFDEVVLADLLADYNMKLDLQIINGSGAAGQVTGILNTAGINAVTYTDATPTLPELWVPLLQAASQVAKNRKQPATGVVLTPSLWYWALSQLDTTTRPLIVPNSNAFNSMGDGGLLESDGPAGVLTYGLPSFLDGNIPSNLGAGTNETRSITARWQDLYLWEGSMRTRVLSEVLSGTLQVRLQVYNYVAFMPNRRPEAISVISGTGMIPAAGF